MCKWGYNIDVPLLRPYTTTIFLSLMILGAKHVESPYIELGQIFTSLYFIYFLVFIPFLNFLEYNLESK